MSHHNDHNDPVDHSPDLEQPLDVDSERSPQLDKVKCRCRSCGCACAASRFDNDITEDGGGGESDDGKSVNGDEGVEKETEFGDMGSMTPLVVRLFLAKHRCCTCSDAARPYACCRNASADGFRSPGSSMRVNPSPSQRSMSTTSLSQVSTDGMSLSSSGFLVQTGAHFDHETTPGYHFIHTPIQLAPEMEFSFPVDIVLHYPSELEIETSTTHDFPMYDLW